jgi:hypothetical protein
MILNTDVKCFHCGIERGSYKLARVVWPIFGNLLVLVLAGLAVASALYVFSTVRERQQETRQGIHHRAVP